MLEKGDAAPNVSGRQEMLENLLNRLSEAAAPTETEHGPESPPTDDIRSAGELQAECRRLSEALTLAERDRQLLGFEIHDGVVQDLTAAAMLLEGAGHHATFTSPS